MIPRILLMIYLVIQFLYKAYGGMDKTNGAPVRLQHFLILYQDCTLCKNFENYAEDIQ